MFPHISSILHLSWGRLDCQSLSSPHSLQVFQEISCNQGHRWDLQSNSCPIWDSHGVQWKCDPSPLYNRHLLSYLLRGRKSAWSPPHIPYRESACPNVEGFCPQLSPVGWAKGDGAGLLGATSLETDPKSWSWKAGSPCYAKRLTDSMTGY